MAKKQFARRPAGSVEEPSPALKQILCDLGSPDAAVRAGAVRQLCPCRGARWELPVFPRVLALRDDPSPIVRNAVEHDLRENPAWGERQEARRMAGWQRRRDLEQARAEIRAEVSEDEAPGLHSLAWLAPRRPRARKRHYPVGRL